MPRRFPVSSDKRFNTTAHVIDWGTPERSRHGRIITERRERGGAEVARVAAECILDQLHDVGHVTPAMHRAGIRLRSDFQRGKVGPQPRPARMSQTVQLPFGVCWLCRAVCRHVSSVSTLKKAFTFIVSIVTCVVIGVLFHEFLENFFELAVKVDGRTVGRFWRAHCARAAPAVIEHQLDRGEPQFKVVRLQQVLEALQAVEREVAHLRRQVADLRTVTVLDGEGFGHRGHFDDGVY